MSHTCPWWGGYFLLVPVRRLLHSPARVLGPFARPGMVVVEPGCGMGFFTLDLARIVSPGGRVIAVDLQPQMLAGLRRRLARVGLEAAVDVRLAGPDRLGLDDLAGGVDLVVAFYMVHEVRDPAAFFAEVARALKPDGTVLVVEPPLHVSRAAFESSLAGARRAGLVVRDRPRIGLNHAALLGRRAADP
jgi:ubiquinone/menaquinone biosynthesis C-methylase UbiE